MEQRKSHSKWAAVSNSKDFPAFVKWIEDEEIPDITSRMACLDPFDKDFTLCYTQLSGELKAFTGIVTRYNTRTKEQVDG